MSETIGGFMKRQQATHAYIGTAPCGCVTAAAVDLGEQTSPSVAEWLADGYSVTRVTLDEYRRRCAEERHFMSFDCPHKAKAPKQLSLEGA